MMRTLFLNPPSYEGFDGGAGARYQARREVRSFWYPTWLAQPAALVPGSKLVDAPAAGLTLADDIPPLASRPGRGSHQLATFARRCEGGRSLEEGQSRSTIGFVGAKVAVEPESSLLASSSIDFVAREEFDFTISRSCRARP